MVSAHLKFWNLSRKPSKNIEKSACLIIRYSNSKGQPPLESHLSLVKPFAEDRAARRYIFIKKRSSCRWRKMRAVQRRERRGVGMSRKKPSINECWSASRTRNSILHRGVHVFSSKISKFREFPAAMRTEEALAVSKPN
jgi:hypothetical protein